MTLAEETTTTTGTIIKDIIQPSNKHNKKRLLTQTKISLHGIEAFIPPLAFSVFWCYFPPPNNLTINKILDNLKDSLAQALELYPPLSGTVHSDDNENYYINLVGSNGPGTPFLFEYKDTPFAINNGGEGLAAQDGKSSFLTSESSVLSVKLTQFSCGTIVIATTVHHQVSDLRSLLDFVGVWASLVRGESIDYSRIPSDWSRTPSRFFPSIDEKPSIPSGWTLHPSPVPFEKIIERAGPVQLLVWNISKSSIDSLKTDLGFLAPTSCSDFPSWISKADALTALIVGAFTRARENIGRPFGRSNPESETDNVTIISNYRTRASQGKIQSGDFFGNCIAMINATVPRDDLLSPNMGATSRTAYAIRNALNKELSSKNVANYLAYFDSGQLAKPHARLQYTWDVVVTNWCQHDLEDVAFDFGWGKPFKGAPFRSSSLPGNCIITNGDKPGDMVFCLEVEPSCAKELEKDPLLKRYAILEE